MLMSHLGGFHLYCRGQPPCVGLVPLAASSVHPLLKKGRPTYVGINYRWGQSFYRTQSSQINCFLCQSPSWSHSPIPTNFRCVSLLLGSLTFAPAQFLNDVGLSPGQSRSMMTFVRHTATWRRLSLMWSLTPQLFQWFIEGRIPKSFYNHASMLVCRHRVC